MGRRATHRLDAGVVQQALELVRKKYSDFGPTLAPEKLVEADQIRISRESVRKIMIDSVGGG